jgi:hypothetical protein
MATYINGYEIDVAVREDHSFESEVTEHPVEVGADVTDHVRARPITVTLEGIVSDTPIGDMAQRRQEFTLVDGEAFAIPSEEALAFLLAIRDAREPVPIQTSLRSYESMMLQSLQIPRSADNGEALRFTATFVQVILVTNQRSVVRVSVPRAANKVNRGNKASAEVTAAPVEVAAPWLLRDDPTLPAPQAANANGRTLVGAGGSSGGRTLVDAGGG